MSKLALYAFVLLSYSSGWVSCLVTGPTFDLNITVPTWAPFLKPAGLFKFVQSCEQFCDEQFPPGVLYGEPLKAVIGCHKGCYSYELFKSMSNRNIKFSLLDKICSANCKKDFADEDFAEKFCSLGCSRMTTLYQLRVKEMRSEYIEKVRQERNKEPDSSKMYQFEQEAEGKIKEAQNVAADEIAVAVLLEHQKEHAVRVVNTGQHRRGFKKRIFHVERLDSSEFRPYVEIQRIDTQDYKEVEEKSERESDSENEAKNEGNQREDIAIIRKLPPVYQKHRVDSDCLIFQIPIYVLTVVVLVFIVIGLWITYGDPMDCLFCFGLFGKKFWEKMENSDLELGADDIAEYNFIYNTNLPLDCSKLVEEDYCCPPPDKDAPPPYLEVTLMGGSEEDCRRCSNCSSHCIKQ